MLDAWGDMRLGCCTVVRTGTGLQWGQGRTQGGLAPQNIIISAFLVYYPARLSLPGSRTFCSCRGLQGRKLETGFSSRQDLLLFGEAPERAGAAKQAGEDTWIGLGEGSSAASEETAAAAAANEAAAPTVAAR
jgi:hypothetical protein